jgi:hypothetical protein
VTNPQLTNTFYNGQNLNSPAVSVIRGSMYNGGGGVEKRASYGQRLSRMEEVCLGIQCPQRTVALDGDNDDDYDDRSSGNVQVLLR